MGDADAEAVARRKHARRLAHGTGHAFAIHQPVIGHDQIERTVREWQCRRIGEHMPVAGMCFSAGQLQPNNAARPGVRTTWVVAWIPLLGDNAS